MSDKIKIDTVTGGKDKDDLKGCYFLESTPGNYLFYDKNNNQITTSPSPVVSGTDFTFTLDGFTWTISSLVITQTATQGSASGNWSNNDPTLSIEDTDGESGTFQAQSGGTIDPEEAASSAKA